MAAPRLYLVTDRRATRDRPLADVVDAALAGGVDAVQLREKDLTTRELVELGRELRAVTRRHGAKLLINDRIDVAIAIDADGVHLPGGSFAVADARALLGPNRSIAVSTHSPADLDRADGADFAVFGPVFDTPSKRAYGAPQGIAALRDISAAAEIPIVAIGGIAAGNAAEVAATSCAGIAVIRAVLAADDPRAAAAALRRAMDAPR